MGGSCLGMYLCPLHGICASSRLRGCVEAFVVWVLSWYLCGCGLVLMLLLLLLVLSSQSLLGVGDATSTRLV